MSPSDSPSRKPKRWRWIVVLGAIVGLPLFFAGLLVLPIVPKKSTLQDPDLKRDSLLHEISEDALEDWLFSSGVIKTARQRLRDAGVPWEAFGPKRIRKLDIVGGNVLVLRLSQPLVHSRRPADLDRVLLYRTKLHILSQKLADPEFTDDWGELIRGRFWESEAGADEYWLPEIESLLESLADHPDRAVRDAIGSYREDPARRFLRE